jgi:nucleotide-binding universal stress UspA family protein
MLKILVYTDGRPEAVKALRFGAELKKRLAAEMAIITVRSSTHATEDPPPVGVDFPLDNRQALPVGLQRLVRAVDVLTDESLFDPQLSVNIRAVTHGHLFICTTPSGERIPFYERFGHFIEALNHVVADHRYDLLIIATDHYRHDGNFPYLKYFYQRSGGRWSLSGQSRQMPVRKKSGPLKNAYNMQPTGWKTVIDTISSVSLKAITPPT